MAILLLILSIIFIVILEKLNLWEEKKKKRKLLICIFFTQNSQHFSGLRAFWGSLFVYFLFYSDMHLHGKCSYVCVYVWVWACVSEWVSCVFCMELDSYWKRLSFKVKYATNDFHTCFHWICEQFDTHCIYCNHTQTHTHTWTRPPSSLCGRV